MKKAMDSREVGLVMGLIAGRYVFQSEDLHYGFWPDELPVTPDHLKQAQDLHSQLILSNIPDGVESILDVGCGAGGLAKRLIDKGYAVDCVSPSGLLTTEAQKLLGDACTIVQGPFETIELNRTYDLVLFSESFQYIKLTPALQQVMRYLKPGGHLLICDFFRHPREERGPIGGGHPLPAFHAEIEKHPLESVVDQDITKETARNYDLVNDLLQRVGVPIWELIFAYGNANYPRRSKWLQRLFRKRIAKLERKYFQGQRTAETFSHYKSYRLLLYRRTTAAA